MISVLPARLCPGDDLKLSLENFARENAITAGWIMSGVGSLNQIAIRFANQNEPFLGKGFFEILTLTGTISENGSHIHISVADREGKVMGGHLMPGNIIYTTAELIIGSSPEYIFRREKQEGTPWAELQIAKKVSR